jgi:hypothetical protein
VPPRPLTALTHPTSLTTRSAGTALICRGRWRPPHRAALKLQAHYSHPREQHRASASQHASTCTLDLKFRLVEEVWRNLGV